MLYVRDLPPVLDGRVVALLVDQELGQEAVLQPDHGTDVVPAQGVVQIEPYAVVILQAKSGLAFRHPNGFFITS